VKPNRTLAVLGVGAMLALLAGCGSDESGQETTAAEVSIPTVTSPLDTTAPTATSNAPKKKKGETTSTAAAPTACDIPDTYQDLKFSGTNCVVALGVATAWDQNGKDCNTIDNPDSPEGYKRTCEVVGYSCTAKRDVHSDGRFVSCTQGGASVRFTWFPI
jgi:hypothetical protein